MNWYSIILSSTVCAFDQSIELTVSAGAIATSPVRTNALKKVEVGGGFIRNDSRSPLGGAVRARPLHRG
jgi:hypothetical protein